MVGRGEDSNLGMNVVRELATSDDDEFKQCAMKMLSDEQEFCPHLQTPTRLNGVICQGIPLWCDRILYTALYS